MRARLIGGLPADLVGSLTGLTQGHFPVHAKARYADDISPTQGRQEASRAATPPTRSSRARRASGINIFAKAGSPVDRRPGRPDRQDRQQQAPRQASSSCSDVYGNTYTYGRLKKVAQALPGAEAADGHARRRSTRSSRSPQGRPEADRAPRRAGTQAPAAPRRPPSRRRPPPQRAPPSRRQGAPVRQPDRPRAYKRRRRTSSSSTAARRSPASRRFKAYFTEVFGLDRDDVELKRPARSARSVIAGTILGRIGKVDADARRTCCFEIRPAGSGAPRIDPKPILDGWKLLESTAIYRAAGKNPFFGAGRRRTRRSARSC